MNTSLVKCKYCGEYVIFAKEHICLKYKDKPKEMKHYIKSGRVNRRK